MSGQPRVVVLAGGTGGAKLARGMLDVAGEHLTVIANTGDDIEIYGAHVSPDPDLCLFWLADRIDARGWGLDGDTFTVMDQLRELGEDIWFNLGDRDLAIGIQRRARLDAGMSLTEATDALRRSLAVPARVLPMCDEPVRTWVRARDEWTPLQEFLIRGRGEGPVQDVEFRGVEEATLPAEVAAAVAAADAIVIGPSNPVISIDPILAVPGMREALAAARAPVVAVSPLIAGRAIKGPTEAFLAWAGQPLSGDGIAAHYHGVIAGLVADDGSLLVPALRTQVLMDDSQQRTALARLALDLCLALARPPAR